MREIIKQVKNVTSNGYSHYNVFSDWLDLMLYALIGNEDKYLEVVHKYPNTRKQGEREIDYMANAFGLLLKEMQETNDELLGSIYINLNVNNKSQSQFFTLAHVAKMMAEITNPKSEVISDPCCGAGIMLVEACKTMTYEDLDNSLFVAQDIDYTCVRMCA
jgi:type I restriction-modification system DNA methylase subunit